MTDARRGRADEARIELVAADHEEPTWELRGPRKRRFDRRSRTILGVAALAAVLANAGAAWAYWRITEQPQRVARPAAEVPIDIVLRGRNDFNQTLRPGHPGNLTVQVSNDLDVPIRIHSVRMGSGNVVADPEHRDAGCTDPRVRMTRAAFPVSWEVGRNTIGLFTVDGALAMARDTPRACLGATFTVPLRARGIRR